MNLKLNELEVNDIKSILAGVITEEQKDELKFMIIANPELTFSDAMQLLQSMTMHLLNTYATQKPEALDSIYDAYNFMSSSVLQNLIPDKELRPDIDEEAILELEAKKIEENYDAIPDDLKEEAAAKLAAYKERLANDKAKKDN